MYMKGDMKVFYITVKLIYSRMVVYGRKSHFQKSTQDLSLVFHTRVNGNSVIDGRNEAIYINLQSSFPSVQIIITL